MPAAPSRCTPRRGYKVKIVCLSYGERGESQFAWKEAGATLAKVKAGRKDEAERAAALLGAEIEFFDAGDYPLRLTEAHFDRMVDIYRETNPSFVLTHALDDPYNFDHPNAAHFAQETRVVAQAGPPSPAPNTPTRRRRFTCSSRTSPSSAISSPISL